MRLDLPEDLESFVIDVPEGQNPAFLTPNDEGAGVVVLRRQTIMIYKVGRDIFDILVFRYFASGPTTVILDFGNAPSLSADVSTSNTLK